MKKKYILISVICVCFTAAVVFGAVHMIKKSHTKEYLATYFTNTALSINSDYSDALKKFNIGNKPSAYEIKIGEYSYALPHDESLEEEFADPNDADGYSAGELYGSLKVKKTGYKSAIFGTKELGCDVYTVTAEREKLSCYISSLKNSQGYAYFRQTLLNAVKNTAEVLNVEVSDEDVINIINCVTPEQEPIADHLSDDFSAEVYTCGNKVYKISTELDFENTDLQKATLDIMLSDGTHMLNRAAVHMGLVINGKTLYFDFSGIGNMSGDTKALGVNVKSTVSYDHLNIFELSLALNENDSKDGFTSSGFYSVSGKRTNINNSGTVAEDNGVLRIEY